MFASPKTKWRQFERIVAAIEFATSHGAEVTWDEGIDGRQFDVTVRFKNGPHQYLTLIECKDHKSPVSVGDIDAFTTKARDAKANKAVIVSASGFQSGCISVAKRHGIELFRLNERLSEPPGAEKILLEPTLGAYDFVLHFPDARAPLAIPETNNRLDYVLLHGVATQNATTGTLGQLFDQIMQAVPMPVEIDKPQKMEVPLVGVTISIPMLLEASPVKSVSFMMAKTMKKFVPANGMDHHLMLKLNTSFELTDSLTNKPVTTIDALRLPIGFKTTFRASTFYTNMLEQNYYCERVDNGNVRLVLVEGYSNGHLIQVRLQSKADVSRYYVEITDHSEIARRKKCTSVSLVKLRLNPVEVVGASTFRINNQSGNLCWKQKNGLGSF